MSDLPPIEDVAKAYSEVVTGYDEPDCMWGLGSSIKLLARDPHDIDGKPLVDDAWYFVSNAGIERMKP